MMSPSPITTHPLTGPNSSSTIKWALSILRPHIPVSLPLYRRLQFGRFFDATTLLTNIPINTDSPERGDEPWLLAFVDRSCRPETEVWFFGSWETGFSITFDQQTEIEHLIRNVVKTMRNLEVPTSIHASTLTTQPTNNTTTNNHDENNDKDSAGISRTSYSSHAANSNIMLWGAIHTLTVPILTKLGYIQQASKPSLIPNHTFLWAVDALPPVKPLPQGVIWGQLQPEHFALVRSRTQIPRQDRTLAVLPNLGIFDENDAERPVAWAFIGLDASLTTLHVEPEFRGRGLAKAITTKLFKEKMGLFWAEGVEKLAHGYVINGNAESEGMCRSLGGRSDWEVYWVRVDLGEV